MKKTEVLDEPKMEINDLTRIPGGYYITVEKMNGRIARGINVKSIRNYLRTTIPNSKKFGNPVKRVYFTGGGNDMIYENGKFLNDKWRY